METALSEARIILASASPRRLELMGYFGIPFAVIPSTAPENAQGTGLEQVRALAVVKGADVYKRHPGYPVLSADTLVCLDEYILGKPKSHAEAAQMLSMLSGRWHQVHTGVCLHMPDGRVLERTATTNVYSVRLAKPNGSAMPRPRSRWIRRAPMPCRASAAF